MKVLIILLFAVIDCSGQSIEQMNNTCKTDGFEKLDVIKLDSLLLGKWEYKYSYVDDTCFHIANLGDLSVSYSFDKADIEVMKSKYPKLYSFGEDKLLFGLMCSNDKKPFGKITYPIINTVAKDSNMVRITHYVEGNGVGKGYSYFLESVEQENLVLRNERSYSLGMNRVKGVRHVYVKQE